MGDWKEKGIGKIAHFSQGIQVPIEMQKAIREFGDVRFIRIVDYTQNNQEERFINNPGEKYIVSKSDIVMVRYGTPGLIGRGINGAIANNMFKINPDEDVISKDYLSCFLNQNHIQKLLSEGSGSTTMAALNFSFLNTILVVFPESKKEQSTISTILTTIDQAIEKTEQLIAKYERIKTGLMQDLLTRGIDEQGNIRSEETHEFKDSPLGRIPKEWEVKKIKEIFLLDPDRKPNELKEIDYISINDVEYPNQILRFSSYNSKNAPSRAQRLIKHGDVLISNVRPYLRAFAIVPEKYDDFVCSTGFTVIRSTEFDSHLLLNFCLSKFFINQLNIVMSGSNYPAVNKSQIGNCLIFVPPYNEQLQIVEIIQNTNISIKRMTNELKKMESIKQALMQDLLTGKVRVDALMNQNSIS